MTDPLIDPAWLTFGGRLHPLLLHLPIGVFFGLAVLELVAALRKRPAAPLSLVLFGGLAAVLSAASGWLLHEEPGYGGDLLELHEWLGIAAAASAALATLLRLFGRTTGYRRMVALTVLLIAPAAHFGASMTHGSDFLLEPLRERGRPEDAPQPFVGLQEPAPPVVAAPRAEAPAETPATPSASYAADIAPILAARCVGCHGEAKKKGRLRLDAPEHILAGGVIGDTVVPGDPGGSEMVYRLRLGPDDEDRMPPPEEPQPTAREVALIEAWIAAGASFEAPFELPAGSAAPAPELEETRPATPSDAPFETPSEGGETSALEPAPRGALAALGDALVHAQPVAEGSQELWIDFAAPAAQMDDARARELLAPLNAHVAELSLARTKISDALLPFLAAMPRLRQLDLRATRVTSAGLAALAGHASLRELVLARTQLDDAAVDTLLALPALERVWLWDAGLTEDALARLRAERPDLRVDAGDAEPAAALEAEPTPTFTSDAPPVDAPPADAPVPVNATCPVSGSPVNAKYTLEFEGRVIGFCCPNCPPAFQADPDSFRAKLP